MQGQNVSCHGRPLSASQPLRLAKERVAPPRRRRRCQGPCSQAPPPAALCIRTASLVHRPCAPCRDEARSRYQTRRHVNGPGRRLRRAASFQTHGSAPQGPGVCRRRAPTCSHSSSGRARPRCQAPAVRLYKAARGTSACALARSPSPSRSLHPGRATCSDRHHEAPASHVPCAPRASPR
jgi:hypothetical protein